MLGAIIGDICGSVYEWDNEKDIAKIELFKEGCFPTDDSIMTVAVGRALIESMGLRDDVIKDTLITSMHSFGRLFPDGGYGGHFAVWLSNYDRRPYFSWGNGSGMRVAAAGWLYPDLEQTLHAAELTAMVTHNHPEGIRGAEAVAAAVYLARTGKSKEEIKKYTEQNYYGLDFTLDGIRDEYDFDVSCQGSCPVAIEAFLEGDGFDDVIRRAISVGGDSDTIAAMAGAVAEAYYGVPAETAAKAMALFVDTVNGRRRYNNSIFKAELRRFWDYLEERHMNSPRPAGF